ncbi:MAG: glycoside-pentoside-hexuronide (GPH):cation symporter [Spirochaetes bacterium]|nr:glycoside-pentoside-hexuronide (GPH):cation symporter [Spirochaetota bacterium]
MSSTTQLSRKEKYSFAIAGFGQNMVITFTVTFMLVYLYEAVGFSTQGIATLTAIITGAKIWDAINDFIMGMIVDHTRTRWGKLRPYILFTAFPIALLTIMLFAIPKTVETYKLIYFGIVYVLWGMIYTIADVPYWGLAGSITVTIHDRVSLIALARTLQAIALAVTTIASPLLAYWLSFSDKTTASGWTRTAILVSIIGMSLFTLAFFNTQEKVPHKQKQTFRQMLQAIVTNKPFLLVLLASALNFGRNIVQVGGAVVAVIVFGSEKIFTLLGGALIAAIIISNIITPYVLQYMSKKTLMIASSIIAAFVYAAMYFVGHNNLWIFVSMLFVSGFFTGFFIVVQTAMIADCVDYYEFKTGQRTEGVSFAGLTFISKLMGALATLAFGLVMVAIGYSSGVTITPEIQNGAFFSITIVPAISCIIGTIPFIFYPLTDQKLADILATLVQRRQATTML